MGAWIETYDDFCRLTPDEVAPYMGAWIETMEANAKCISLLSHPTWVRGLKLLVCGSYEKHSLSHPTWVRGLKLNKSAKASVGGVSHPTWVRGLKRRHELWTNCTKGVAPYMGAWIETVMAENIELRKECRTLHGCVE